MPVPPSELKPRDWGLGEAPGSRPAGQAPQRRVRATVCALSQAGCAMGCTFCATGQFGFTRHLSAGEIVEQVARGVDAAAGAAAGTGGAGPPDQRGLHGDGGAARQPGRPPGGRPTGSTRGSGCRPGPSPSRRSRLVPGIAAGGRRAAPVNAWPISIHAADDATRDRLVPVNRTWPIAELLDAIRDYVTATRRGSRSDNALMDRVNDDLEQSRAAWSRLLSPLRVPGSGARHLTSTLIPYNPTPASGSPRKSQAAVRHFRDTVAASGVPVSVRANPRGRHRRRLRPAPHHRRPSRPRSL